MPLLSYKWFANCLVLLRCELALCALVFADLARYILLCELNVQFVLVIIKPFPIR